MGTSSFAVGTYGKNAARVTMSSTLRTSGNHTTTTTASNIQVAAADITLASGEIIEVYASVAMRIRFGGIAATTTTGFYIPAAEKRWFECNDPGTVSIADVA